MDTGELVAAIKALEDEEKEAVGKVLAPHIPTTLSRRQMLGIAGVAGMGAVGGAAGPAAANRAVEPVAAADGVVNDIDDLQSGDGTPIDVLSPLNLDDRLDTHAVTKSSAYTTSGESYIDVDTSAAGVTITLATADTVLGHYVVIRQNGANDVTIDTEGAETIDGSSSLTLQHDQAVVTLWSDGSNWFSDQFTDTVDARRVTTDDLTINNALIDTTFSIGSGATVQQNISSTPGDPVIIQVLPNNDPGNNFGLDWDVIWHDSSGNIRVVITETESAGGGEVRVLAWRLG